MTTGILYIRRMAAVLMAIFFIFGQSSPAGAQGNKTADSTSAISLTEFYLQNKIQAGTPGIHEYAFWGGYSFHSSSGIWGQTSGATLSVVGLRYNRKFIKIPQDYLLKYVVEANMFVHYELAESTTTSSLSGFGMTPVGLQLNWKKNPALQPFFKSSTGFMYLSNPFPDPRGTQFNFTLEIGIGTEIKITDNAFFTIGYKYHHMSNGRFGQINPGVDSNMFYGGITIH